jgi:lysophospholipid acyltransferase (LPLAT)-like uncharacterized protein
VGACNEVEYQSWEKQEQRRLKPIAQRNLTLTRTDSILQTLALERTTIQEFRLYRVPAQHDLAAQNDACATFVLFPHIEPFIDSDKVCAPAYWHQHHIPGSTLIRSWIRRGFKACFLISGSVDGDVPERIARAWGAEVIRGSANKSGALALRDQQQMMKNGYSIVTTADGPRGPKYEFKAGTVLMARIAGVPIIPIGCAADRAWYLKRWDNFLIPKPFARIVIAIGEPVPVPRDVPLDALEPVRLNVQEAVMSLMRDSEKILEAD